MRRRVDDVRCEGERRGAGVDVGHDRFELLREDRDQIELTVAVQIRRDRMDRAGPVVNHT
jgi:hypothetical protein